MMEFCKYYREGLRTCAALISAVYELGGSTGGLAHVAIDDGNVDDRILKWTIGLCEQEKDRPEAPVVKLLCELLLKQPLESRIFLVNQMPRFGIDQLSHCMGTAGKGCDDCFVNEEIQEWIEGMEV